MLIRKTPTAKRENYVYRFEDGSRVVIEGGEAMDKWIKMLHSLDDAEVYNNIKNGRPPVENWEKESIERWKEEHPDEDLEKNWSLSMDSLLDIDNVDDSLHALQLSEKVAEDIDSLSELVREKVIELTVPYQELYRLYYIEGYSQEEIARLQNISQKNVCVKLGKLKKHLVKLCRERI